MKNLLLLVAAWSAISIALGVIGSFELNRIWRTQASEELVRDAAAARNSIDARTWAVPAESDPAWKRMEKELRLAVVPVVDAAGAPTVGDAPQSPPLEWATIESEHRLSTVVALDHPLGMANAIRVTRLAAPNSAQRVWWIAWSLLNISAVAMTLYGARWLRESLNSQRQNLQAWVESTQSENEDFLLADAEIEEPSLASAMSLIANNVNKSHRRLKLAKERSELVFDNLREGVMAVDHGGKVLLANRALVRLLKLPDEDVLYRPFLEVVRTPAIAELIASVLTHRSTLEQEVEIGTQPNYLRVAASPLPLGKSSSGEARSGALITARDETYVKRVELIRRDFVANASHELRTPLAAIRAYAETLQLGAIEDREAAENFIGNIITQSDRIDSLVQGMLQLSRVEVGIALDFAEFDVLAALEPCLAAAEAMASTKGVEVIKTEVTGGVQIRSDRDAFQTIAGNLLSNAVRYTPAGGTVRVKTSIVGDTLRVEVCDTGIGMRQQDLERAFERFYRAEKARSSDTGGTGLGLSIVKHLTQALGGTVSATSKPHEGSSFVIQLPMPQPPNIDEDPFPEGVANPE